MPIRPGGFEMQDDAVARWMRRPAGQRSITRRSCPQGGARLLAGVFMNTELLTSTVGHLMTMSGAGPRVGALQPSGSELIRSTQLAVLKTSASHAAEGLTELNLSVGNEALSRIVTDIADTLGRLDAQPSWAGPRLVSTAESAMRVLGKLT